MSSSSQQGATRQGTRRRRPAYHAAIVSPPITANNCSKRNYAALSSCLENVETSTSHQVQQQTKQKGWKFRMQQLQSFYETYGHSRVTSKTETSYPGLYQWVRSIRGPRRKDRLNEHQLEALRHVAFCWNAREMAWQSQYNRLQEFYDIYGHCRVPNNSKEFPGLGVWVRNQRREHRYWLEGTRRSTLTSERRLLLESIDFEWYRPHEIVWQERYERLCDFAKRHGHANIRQADESLGQWVSNQRTAYRKFQRGEPTAMTEERIKKLQAIGFSFAFRRKRWEGMVERLRDYHTLHGNTNISTDDTPNQDLRLWLIAQRFKYNQGVLSQERILAMEDAIPGFEWFAKNKSGPSQKEWAKLFVALRDKGISPQVPARQYWLDGTDPFAADTKDVWTPEELLDLWNQEDDEEDDEMPY